MGLVLVCRVVASLPIKYYGNRAFHKSDLDNRIVLAINYFKQIKAQNTSVSLRTGNDLYTEIMKASTYVK